MYIHLESHENKSWHIKWCKNKNCEKCKEYIKYIKEHNPGRYDKMKGDN